MKAITITRDNQQMLATRYNLDVGAFPIGYIMVANWGDNGEYRYEGVLTEENFNAKYVRGQALENGFYSITKKD